MKKLQKILFFLLGVSLVCFFSCQKKNDTAEVVEHSEVRDGMSSTIKPNTVKKKKEFSRFEFGIEDENNNKIFEVGEELTFKIRVALGVMEPEKFTWQFGEGGTGAGANPTYTYKGAGKYLVSLLLDGKEVIAKVIVVDDIIKPAATDSIVKIYAPKEAFVGEEVIFRALGTGVNYWAWEFGERIGLVSSKSGGQVVHKYENAGKYTVKVNTNMSEYPIHHNIEVLPIFEPFLEKEVEEVDTKQLYEDDIKERLQMIADANISDMKTFKTNLNYIRDKYLIRIDSVFVVTNGSRYNDFISYCQGIHHLDSEFDKSVTIQEVKIDTLRVKRIEVTQVEQIVDF